MAECHSIADLWKHPCSHIVIDKGSMILMLFLFMQLTQNCNWLEILLSCLALNMKISVLYRKWWNPIIDPLRWWKGNHLKYPHHKHCIFQVILATYAQSEWVWSQAARILYLLCTNHYKLMGNTRFFREHMICCTTRIWKRGRQRCNCIIWWNMNQNIQAVGMWTKIMILLVRFLFK